MTDRPPTPFPILGASVPRAGHHHLSRLAKTYFGDRLRYCAVYRRTCCRMVPCADPRGRPVTFQKSHDFDGVLPTDVAGALYVIQHRAPVANVISAAELIAAKQGMRSPGDGLVGRLAFYNFLAAKLAYIKRFHEKWIVAPPANALILDYARLAADPAGTLRALAKRVDGEADEDRVAAAVEEVAHSRPKGAPYVPRRIEQSPFFDRDALAVYEAAVIATCSGFGYAPNLGGASFRGHPIWWLANLRHGFNRPPPSPSAIAAR